jgi:beta-mannosidase
MPWRHSPANRRYGLSRGCAAPCNIFDESDPRENDELYRLADSLHIRTKPALSVLNCSSKVGTAMNRLNVWTIARGFSLAALFTLCTGHAAAQASLDDNASLSLDKGWKFRQVTAAPQGDGGEWFPAKVPGDVHLDLLANKKISDPFYRDNEAKLQWIENASWEYRLDFDVTPEFFARTNVDLVFDGIDAAAQVFVNGEQVLDADNMFRVWRVPAKSHLHAGRNHLSVVFPSPIRAAERAAAGDPFHLQSKIPDRTYIRKAAYEYGWDWGPRLVTSGIWRPIHLEAWNKLRIADFAIRQRDVSHDVAHLSAEFDIEASVEGDAKLDLHYMTNGNPVALSTTVIVHKGHNLVEIPIEIVHPRLWYPAGYGEQFLYSFTARISTANQIATERTVKTGLRSIELRRQLDQWGRSFELVVNGIPVFAKGADVIPFDSFPSRVTTADYRRILQSARDANMNMIRDWGGGYYETDEFYALCDELGIMVWQDFMFANNSPGTYAFKLNIEAEAEDQVRRLRNHPSIVLWCGNNEVETALNWAPLNNLPADVKSQMWQNYLTEFSGILPRVVARLDPEIPYWPSSPSADYEPLSDQFQSGDAHDWAVWHGRAPFSEYELHNWRFVTEYGFQSFPEMRTVESFTGPQDRTGIFTPIMLAHQKNNEGNSIIQEYAARDYPRPKDFAGFLYLSQVLQAEGIKIGAEHFRRNRPRTMGSIFWQLNDCWPVASWSSIDYYGRWKALQYYARRFYAPILVSPHIKTGTLEVYVVSDKTEAVRATLRVRLMDFDGKVLMDETHSIDVAPLASNVVLAWPLEKLANVGVADVASVFAVTDLTANGTELSRNLTYLLPLKQIHLKPAILGVETIGTDRKFKIRVTSPVLARSVYLSFGDLDVHVSDNYFDLLPGETAEIEATTLAQLNELKANLKVVSLTDAFAASERAK